LHLSICAVDSVHSSAFEREGVRTYFQERNVGNESRVEEVSKTP